MQLDSIPNTIINTTKDSTLTSLYRHNFAVKNLLLNLHYRAKSGHVGSALSCAELLTFIRFYCWEDDSKLVLSKGHAASVLYSVLATAGDISETQLIEGYYRDGTLFSAHPPPNKLNNIPFATGSLGHGPGICNGLALGAKIRGSSDQITFCVLSDGELNEGSVWEAFAFAAHNNLNNLIYFIDRNRLQGFGTTAEVLDLEPLGEKLQSFGINLITANGHDFDSLIDAYALIDRQKHGPSAILADTIKGRGLPGLEGTVDSHYLPMTPEVFEGALEFCERELTRKLLSNEAIKLCELNSPQK
jgi:transketolase